MQKGTVKWYDSNKRFGFIMPEGGDKDIFVHASSLNKINVETLEEGQKLEYDLGENNGRPCAINLRLV